MGAASGVAQRLAQKFISTPMETAKISNMAASIELQRQRMCEDERRFLIQMQENRNLHLQRMQNERSLQEHLRQIDRWPLQIMAPNILKASSSVNGQALNVILKLSATESDLPSAATVKTRNALVEAADMAVQRCEGLFGRTVSVFNEFHLLTSMTGRALSATLFGLLSSVPVALVEARVSSGSKLCVSVSIWGWELEPDTHVSETARIALDFASLWSGCANGAVTIKAAGERAVRLLSDDISALIAQLGDSFHVLRQPHNPPALRLPWVMVQQNADLSEGHWIEIVNNYVNLNDHIGLMAPPLAAESTARMAMSAFEAGQRQFANLLLEKSVLYLKSGIGLSAVDDAQFVEQLMFKPKGKQTSLVQQALGLIRGAQLHGNSGGSRSSRRLGLAEMSRLGITRLNRS